MAHLLVADDQDRVRQALVGMVERMGHTCAEAADLIEVVEAVEESQHLGPTFDLVLLDYDFTGGATGLEIMESLGRAYCEGRVLMLTGQPNPDIEAEARALGAVDFLRKPIVYEALAAAVTAALARLARTRV